MFKSLKLVLTKRFLLFAPMLWPAFGLAQIWDLNFLSPMVTAEVGYYSPSGGDLNHEQRIERLGLQFPIKSKLSLGVGINDLLQSSSLKDAISKVEPKAYQIMGNVDFYHGSYSNEWTPTASQPQDLLGSRIGFTGIHAWFKNKKPGSFIWNANVAFLENMDDLSTYKPNISAFGGTGGPIKLKAIWFAGVYFNYYNRFFATPFVYLNGKLKGRWKYEIIAPKELKLVYKQSSRWKQSFVFGLDGSQFRSPAIQSDSTVATNGIHQIGYLKGSTQARLKLGKRVNWFLEAGYYFDGVYQFHGESLHRESLDGGWMARTKLTFSVGKALVSSTRLGLDF